MKLKLIGGLLAGAMFIGLASSGDSNKVVQESVASPAAFAATVETKQEDSAITTTDASEGFVEPSPSPTPSPTPTPTPSPTPKPTVKPTPIPTPKPIVISTPKATPTPAPAVTSGGYSCNCSKTCDQMSSCAEAQYQLNTCGCGRRDADNDGVACDADCQ